MLSFAFAPPSTVAKTFGLKVRSTAMMPRRSMVLRAQETEINVEKAI